MQNFKEYRLRANLNQTELAERLNVTQACVSRWERGCSYPEIDTAKKLSKELGISLDTIYGNHNTIFPTEIPVYQAFGADGSRRICTKPGAFLQITSHEMLMFYPRVLLKENESPEIKASHYFGYYNESTNMMPKVMPDSINIMFKTDHLFPNSIHLVNIDEEDSVLVRLSQSGHIILADLDIPRGIHRNFTSKELRNGTLKIIGVLVQSRMNYLI